MYRETSKCAIGRPLDLQAARAGCWAIIEWVCAGISDSSSVTVSDPPVSPKIVKRQARPLARMHRRIALHVGQGEG